MEQEEIKDKLNNYWSISTEEKAYVLWELIEFSRRLFPQIDNHRFYRYFAEMVQRLGDGVRPFVKGLYLGLTANLPSYLYDDIDESDKVKKYWEDARLGDFAFNKLLYVEYPCSREDYPEISMRITKDEYHANRGFYDRLDPQIIKMVIENNDLTEELSSGWGVSIDVIADLVYKEMCSVGMKFPIIRPLSDEEIEDIFNLDNEDSFQREKRERRNAELLSRSIDSLLEKTWLFNKE